MKRIIVLAVLASALLTTQGSKAADSENVAIATLAATPSVSCDMSSCPGPCPMPCPQPCAEDQGAMAACTAP